VCRIGKENLDYVLFGDPRAMRQLRERAPGLFLNVYWDAAKKVLPALTAVSAAVILVLTYWGRTLAYETMLRFLPEGVEQKVGVAMLNKLVPAATRCRDLELSGAVQELANRLSAALPERDEFLGLIITDEVAATTFSLPGGRIVVSRGMLLRCQTPDALAGVLAHEILHHRKKHTLKLMISRLAAEGLATAITGSTSGRLDSLVSGLGAVIYSLDQEAEVENEVFTMLRAAKIPLQPFLGFHDELDLPVPGKPRTNLYLAAHPTLGNRAARLRSQAGDAGVAGPGNHDPEKWRTLILGCDAGAK
jgi:predicted Zn-dependent protease